MLLFLFLDIDVEPYFLFSLSVSLSSSSDIALSVLPMQFMSFAYPVSCTDLQNAVVTVRHTLFCSLVRPLSGLTVIFLHRHSESFVQIAQPMYLITLHVHPHFGGVRFSYRLTSTAAMTETSTLAFQ